MNVQGGRVWRCEPLRVPSLDGLGLAGCGVSEVWGSAGEFRLRYRKEVARSRNDE